MAMRTEESNQHAQRNARTAQPRAPDGDSQAGDANHPPDEPAATAANRIRGEPGEEDDDAELEPFPEPRRATVLIDEVAFTKDCSYRTAHEACGEILNDEMYYLFPHVSEPNEARQSRTYFSFFLQPVMLAVHTAESKKIMYPAGQQLRAATMQPRDTTLDAYFKLNQTDDQALGVLLDELRYIDVPEYFVFQKIMEGQRDTGNRRWKRACGGFTHNIGSLNKVSPKSRELWFLRRLLMHVKRPRSYEDLRTVDGVQHEYYRDACMAMGLLQDDAEFDRYFIIYVDLQSHQTTLTHRALDEAQLGMQAYAFRLLFFQILLHGQPSNPNVLFEKYWEKMAGRFAQRNRTVDEVKLRLKRFLARKLLYNHAELDDTLFAGVQLDQQDPDFEHDEGAAQDLPAPSQAVIDGICNERHLCSLFNLTNSQSTWPGPIQINCESWTRCWKLCARAIQRKSYSSLRDPLALARHLRTG